MGVDPKLVAAADMMKKQVERAKAEEARHEVGSVAITLLAVQFRVSAWTGPMTEARRPLTTDKDILWVMGRPGEWFSLPEILSAIIKALPINFDE